ncbi:MAG TPA: hypothetical protein VFH27_16075 [Longimicrobiaceae bacterium]|nr:hypothetical protein [Longimicrobiaceae bacterium]
MKKRKLENLTVESFATVPPPPEQGIANADGFTFPGCPESYWGTCWMTDFQTCDCDTKEC